LGSFTIGAGVLLVVAGLVRYRKTRAQLDSGTFEPAGFVLDLITILTVLFGLALAGYLIYAEKSLGEAACSRLLGRCEPRESAELRSACSGLGPGPTQEIMANDQEK